MVDIRNPGRIVWTNSRPLVYLPDISRPGPAYGVRGGVQLTTDRSGALILRRLADGKRRIVLRTPPVDAELTNDGLFYTHNRGRPPHPGRIVFIPFGQLFP